MHLLRKWYDTSDHKATWIFKIFKNKFHTLLRRPRKRSLAKVEVGFDVWRKHRRDGVFTSLQALKTCLPALNDSMLARVFRSPRSKYSSLHFGALNIVHKSPWTAFTKTFEPAPVFPFSAWSRAHNSSSIRRVSAKNRLALFKIMELHSSAKI